jgi:DNA-binding CsgD family transcriptional regulator
VLSSSGNEDELRHVAGEALELARQTSQLDAELDALMALASVGIESGDRDDLESRAIVDRIIEIAPATPRGQAARLVAQTARYGFEGFEGTGIVLEAWLKSPAAADAPGPALSATANLSFMYLATGRLEDAVRTGGLAIDLAVNYGDPELEAFARQNVAIALAELGRLAEAAQILTRGLAIAASVGTPLPMMDALRAGGTIAALLGRARDAAWLLGAAEAAYAPTRLADPEDDISSGAGRHWRTARRALDPVAWEVARREGRQADASVAFDRALSVLRADVASDQPGRPRLRHADLTAREIEILTLLGEGRTDPQIGERLFISPKTASVHVANVKAKLGVANRLEVALRAREMGLVTSIPDQKD